ncbi:MAG: hypothetical protein KDA89_24745, partial [Planctomycetaceae bacterium]|nr:hypothetical protein [Planctomycetaceae bacterium]
TGSGAKPLLGYLMLNAEELDYFRKLLTGIQARIRGDVRLLKEEAFSAHDHASSNHMADMGSDEWDVDFSLRIVENDEEALAEIVRALNKIEAGTFGLCELCLESGVPEAKARIPKARLNAIPYARNCVNCERKREESK